MSEQTAFTPAREKRPRLLPLLLCVVSGMLPAFYLYAQNALEASLRDILLPLGVSLAVGLAVFFALWLLLSRDSYLAGLLGALCTAAFASFSHVIDLTALLTGTDRSLYAYALCGLILLLALIVLLLVRKKHSLKPACMLACILVGAVLAINVVTAVPQAVKRLSVKPVTYASPAVETERPNIYYFITDEYCEFGTIKEYFLYDNDPFRTFLETRGFDVSDTSYNETDSTENNIANNLNFAVVSDADTPYETTLQLIAAAPIFGELNGLDYTCYAAQSMPVYPLTDLVDAKSLSEGPMTISGKSLAKVLLENTMLRPVMWHFRLYNNPDTTSSVVFDYLCNPENLAGFAGNTAVFAYVQAPHAPYMHRPDGSVRPREDWTDVTAVDRYLDQYIYVTTRLEELIGGILKNDPGCIFILQSDHNYRCAVKDNDLPLSGKVIPDPERTHILNAVYFAGEPVEIEGLTGPETLRYVLDRLEAK